MKTQFDAHLAGIFLALGDHGISGEFGHRCGVPGFNFAYDGGHLPLSLRFSHRTDPDEFGHNLFFFMAGAFMQDEAHEASMLSSYDGWVAYCRGITREAMIQTWPFLAPLFPLIDAAMPAPMLEAA